MMTRTMRRIRERDGGAASPQPRNQGRAPAQSAEAQRMATFRRELAAIDRAKAVGLTGADALEAARLDLHGAALEAFADRRVAHRALRKLAARIWTKPTRSLADSVRDFYTRANRRHTP